MDRITEVMLINARKEALSTYFYMDAVKKQGGVSEEYLKQLSDEYEKQLAIIRDIESGGW